MRTLLEMLAVVAIGAGVGLGVNAFRSGHHSFALNTNHFEKKAIVRPGHPTQRAPVETDADAKSPAPKDPRQELLELGYQPIDHEEVVELYQSEQYQVEQVIFVDARDDEHYAKGHIAGAFQLDHYRVDQYIDHVLPACQNATKVVVYCSGGDCEDSMLAAGDLIERGVDPSRVFVYVGGVKAWKRDMLPFEAGERNSGQEVYLDE